MNKKKIIWYVVMLVILTVAILIGIPYIFTTTNLISKNSHNYTYEEAKIIDLEDIEESVSIKNDEGKVDKLLKDIDELSIKKVKEPKEWSTYGISFVATYKKEEGSTYTEEVFFIRFYKDNVIGFKKAPKKEVYYKIQDEEFNIKEVIGTLSSF